MPVTEVDTRLIMIAHAREGEETECPKRQSEYDGVARPTVGVSQGIVERFGALAPNRQRQSRDVAFLTVRPLRLNQPSGLLNVPLGLVRLRAHSEGAGESRLR